MKYGILIILYGNFATHQNVSRSSSNTEKDPDLFIDSEGFLHATWFAELQQGVYYCSTLDKVVPEDATAPTIDQPGDITYVEGSIGHNITWHPRDANPHMYNVTKNNTLVPGKSGNWDGGDITVNVDGLSVGNYIFTCNVNDTFGNSVSDSVSVTVTEAEEEEGFPWLWVGIGVVILVAGIGAVVLYYKKIKE